MSKFHLAIFIGLIGAIAAGAGQIQIGGANGITSAYISNPTAHGCSTCAAGSGVDQAVAGHWGERSYMVALFNSAYTGGGITTSDGSNTGAALVPTTSTGSTASNTTFSDPNNGGVVFNLLADGAGANGNTLTGGVSLSNNFWGSVNNATMLTIPIGVFGVDKVWLMLNDYWGSDDVHPVIKFNFSTVSGSSTPTIFDTLTLTNSNSGIRSSVDCLSVVGSGGTPTVSCPGTITGHPDGVAAGIPIITAPTPVTVGDATVTTSTIWDGTYNTRTNGAALVGPYNNSSVASTGTGTSGNLVLDDTLFDFASTYTDKYLVSISITSGLSGSTNNLSRLALSAITVDAVPEPSTVALFGTGLSLLGLSSFRRRRS